MHLLRKNVRVFAGDRKERVRVRVKKLRECVQERDLLDVRVRERMTEIMTVCECAYGYVCVSGCEWVYE